MAARVVAAVVGLVAIAESAQRSPEPPFSPSRGPKSRLRDPYPGRALGCRSLRVPHRRIRIPGLEDLVPGLSVADSEPGCRQDEAVSEPGAEPG